MADTNNLEILKGVDTVAFFRKLANAGTEQGHLVPWQTSLSFAPSQKTDSTVTKDGSVTTSASPETKFEIEFLNNTSAIADAFYDSVLNGDILEGWIVYRNRKNSDGKYFAWYMRCTVSEDSSDNDPDGNSTRSVSLAVSGTPKRGWTTLPAIAEEALDYIFRGVDKVTAATGDTPETNGGAAWTDTDAGTNK